MLKIVVFDGGFGGELFADYLNEKLPIVDVIRVIDWRNADKLLTKAKEARKVAETSLRPYLGKTDLIVFANHFLTITSLKYFCRKYKNQKFIGLNLKQPDSFEKRDTLILTTKAVTKTINFHNYLFRLKRKVKILALDSWPAKIDDGELSYEEISKTINLSLLKENFKPKDVILACAQFSDIKTEIRACLGHNMKIYDSFDDAFRKTCKVLRIRGGLNKKKS